MLVDILEEHVDEAVDLFGRRLLYLDMLDMTLGDLAELDRRLIAHLDALTASPDAAWEFCRPFLAEEEADGAFVAAWLATFMASDEAAGEAVRKALIEGTAAVREGVTWAWCLSNAPRFENALLLTCREGDPGARASAIDALGFRRQDPGEILDGALRVAECDESIAALRCAGRLGAERARSAAEAHAGSDHPRLAATAVTALARIDPERGRRRCVELLSAAEEPDPELVYLLGAIGQTTDIPMLIGWLPLEGIASRQAAVALGFMGHLQAVSPLIELLNRPDRAGVATFALRQMFGSHTLGDELDATPGGHAEEEPWSLDDDLPCLDPKMAAERLDGQRGTGESSEAIRHGAPRKSDPLSPSTPVGIAPLVAIESLTEEGGGPAEPFRGGFAGS